MIKLSNDEVKDDEVKDDEVPMMAYLFIINYNKIINRMFIIESYRIIIIYYR